MEEFNEIFNGLKAESNPEEMECTNGEHLATDEPSPDSHQEKCFESEVVNDNTVAKQSEVNEVQIVNFEKDTIVKNEDLKKKSEPTETECLIESTEQHGLSEAFIKIVMDSSHESSQEPLDKSAKDFEEMESDKVALNGTPVGDDTGVEIYSDSYLEIAKITEPFQGIILKGCKWSPDGSCLLTSSEDNCLRLFDLPTPLYTKKVWKTSEDKSFQVPVSLKVSEIGQIYDYEWYPFMSSNDPSTCCFISTSAGTPVHLWNAYTGALEGKYSCYSCADEVVAAMSVSFSFSGDKIFCGHKDNVSIFRTDAPGRAVYTISTKALSGQKGLLSCIALNPSLPQVFAVGSYSKSVGLYTENGDNLCLLYGHHGGVTHLKFSNDGSKLFTGARKDREILCWDLRSPGKVLCSLPRSVFTNQRIYFDITPEGNYLLSGNTDGFVSMWNLEDLPKVSSDEFVLNPILKFRAHIDSTNGCSVNRKFPVLATASGSWHVPDIVSDEESDQLFDNESIRNSIENTAKLWWMGTQET